MVVYMAQMTTETSRMIGGLTSAPLLPFAIPVFFSIILVIRNPISFNNKRFWGIFIVFLIWSFLIIIEKSLFTRKELSYYFFLFYAIIIAYIHVQIFGKQIFSLYEDILVKLSCISLCLWLFSIMLPSEAASLFKLFPESLIGNNVFYIFQWVDQAKAPEDYFSIVARNAGCSWEPGRFSIMVVLAIYCNLSRKGLVFRGNKNLIVLLLTVGSTLSTTGYISTLFLLIVFYFNKISVKKFFLFLVLGIPLVGLLFSMEFMSEKIMNQLDLQPKLIELEKEAEYYNKSVEEGEYVAALGRFESMYFEWENIKHTPLLGYGRNTSNSYFAKEFSSNFELTGGLLKLIGQHGIFLGIFLYIVLWFSSIMISKEMLVKKKYALFFVFLFYSVSYTVFSVPIFTAIWLYSLFAKRPVLKN